MPKRPEHKRRDHLPVKETGPGDNKNEESKKLHHDRGPSAFTETPAIVQAAPPASPLRFYARLRHQLESRGIDYDALPRFTEPGSAPPCFSKVRVPFGAWLSSASLLGATVPYRYDMPAEPNYCFDCTRACQAAMKQRGLCNFPSARFETARNLVPDDTGRRVPETEVLGVSRPARVDMCVADVYDALDRSINTEEPV